MKPYLDKLRIKDVKNLAKLLKSSPEELLSICKKISSSPESYYTQWTKKTKTGKSRPMVKIHGRLKIILDKLNKLLQRIKVPDYVHGGVKGKSTVTNVIPHTGKPMVVRVDLEKHFPNTSNRKINKMFTVQQECNPDVSRILTRLTTLNNGLPQGSPTSASISNLVTMPLSNRLKGFAISRGVTFTQYIDDHNFSGERRLAKYKTKIEKIVGQGGFKVNPTKTLVMPANSEQVITGIRVNSKKLDVPSKYLKDVYDGLDKLQRDTINTGRLSEKLIKKFEEKIRYASRFNKGAAKPLKRKLDHIKSIINK
jgi:hypothetical protein